MKSMMIVLAAVAVAATVSCAPLGKYKALEATNQILIQDLATSSNRIAELETLANDLQGEISNQQTNMTQELSNLEAAHQSLLSNLQKEISNGQIQIQKIKGVLTMNIADKIFFDSGKAELKQGGISVLSNVALALAKIPEKMVRVEGHTDNVPIHSTLTNKYTSNWELSSARATTVVRWLEESGKIDASRLSATGYADTHPIAGNGTERGRAKNRRIEIVLLDKQLYQVMETKQGLESK
jgi:chemotaxis protein MotB